MGGILDMNRIKEKIQHGVSRKGISKMNNVFCTILSKLRVYQGLVLERSLNFNLKDYTLYILCIDDEAYSICSKMELKNTILVRVQEVENEELLRVKQGRALNEYCWTLKPYFIDFIMKQKLPFDFITYVDADMCFFNDPTPIFEHQRNHNVLLSEHDYINAYKGVEAICGRYNSGFITFRNVEAAKPALKWWKDRCLEWCYDNAVDGKFGDQKYLDEMSRIFPGAYSISTPGVNIAPWNEAKYHFSIKNEKIYVNQNILICYHFSGFRIVSNESVALLIGTKKIYDIVHLPYMHVLRSVLEDIEKVDPDFKGFNIEKKFRQDANYVKL